MTESNQENSLETGEILVETEPRLENVEGVTQNAQEKISEVENGANQALENGEKRMKSAVELAMEKEDVNIPTEYLKVQEEMKNFSEETRLKVQEELDSLKFEAKMLEKEGREEDKVKNEIEPNIYKLEDKQRRLDDIEELLALKEEANRLEKEGKDEDKVVYILEPRIKELEKKLKGEKVEQNPEVAPAEEIEGNEADTEEKKSEASHHFEVAEEASKEPLSKDEVEAPTQETPIEQPAEEAPAETDEKASVKTQEQNPAENRKESSRTESTAESSLEKEEPAAEREELSELSKKEQIKNLEDEITKEGNELIAEKVRMLNEFFNSKEYKEFISLKEKREEEEKELLNIYRRESINKEWDVSTKDFIEPYFLIRYMKETGWEDPEILKRFNDFNENYWKPEEEVAKNLADREREMSDLNGKVLHSFEKRIDKAGESIFGEGTQEAKDFSDRLRHVFANRIFKATQGILQDPSLFYFSFTHQRDRINNYPG